MIKNLKVGDEVFWEAEDGRSTGWYTVDEIRLNYGGGLDRYSVVFITKGEGMYGVRIPVFMYELRRR